MRNFSTFFKEAINGKNVGCVITKLVEISHESITPIRYTQDNQPVTHQGNVYTPYDFVAQLTDQSRDQITNGILTVSNIDRSLLETLSRLPNSGDLVAKLTIIGLPWPDVQQLYASYKLGRWNWNRYTLNVTLMQFLPFNEKIPGDDQTPDKFPAAFGT